MTGLSNETAKRASSTIEQNGGEMKSSFVLNTNYLIYDPVSGVGTTKHKKAPELIEKSNPIPMISISEFMQKLND